MMMRCSGSARLIFQPLTQSTSSVIFDQSTVISAGSYCAVAVGVEDVVLGRRREPGAQHAAVAAIRRVMDDAEMIGIDPRQLVEDLRRVVAAAVVDDDDFKVGGERAATLTAVITRLAMVPPSL